ncbi:thioredoxin fold domain-containing protein [Mucilaginibacter sp. dw_454]|uniref:thioredoxin fold domain-containing protein n=1 Tax=Mucilaginibacter sp. dw_454 TaxID=2720079 RepID=UPI001BD35B7F|nr:thioredoxin fold domain-containing protein [Mucilaginibacter sp. dw_454]
MKQQKLSGWILVIFIVFLLPALSLAQTQTTGIKFETGLNWEQVKAKAKAENKYIFIDCYATWCGPCKIMDAEVFPKKEVGEYFNAHFINVKVQIDRTVQDAAAVKAWYNDAKQLETTYEIHAFPSYLFFSSDGNAVHYVVGARDTKTFISRAKDALDPDKQYYSMMAHWSEHTTDSAYLYRAMNVAHDNYNERAAKVIGDAYLKNLKDPFSIDNLVAIRKTISSSNDPGFQIFVSNEEKINAIMKNPAATFFVIAPIIYSEDIKPQVLKTGIETNWKKLEGIVKVRYPKLAIWKATSIDSAFFSYFLASAEQAEDKEIGKIIGGVYLKYCNGTLTKSEIQLIVNCVTSSQDQGFQWLVKNRLKANKTIGKNYVETILSRVVVNEEVAPLFSNTSDPINYNALLTSLRRKFQYLDTTLRGAIDAKFMGQTISEIGDMTKQKSLSVTDWDSIVKKLAVRFPGYDYQFPLLVFQMNYYARKEKWPECERLTFLLLQKYGNKISPPLLNHLGWYFIFLHASDVNVIEETSKWMRLALIQYPKESAYVDTYANLLYKIGHVSEAIQWENRAIEMVSSSDPDKFISQFQNTLIKMKKGEPTWSQIN